MNHYEIFAMGICIGIDLGVIATICLLVYKGKM